MVTIVVISKRSGDPLEGKRVSISYGGFFSGGTTDKKRTDSRGEVHFDIKPCQGKVYVEGDKVYEGEIAGRVVVYI